MGGPSETPATEAACFEPKVLIPRPARLAVLLSGGGRTLENLVDCIHAHKLDAEIATVICSRAGIGGIARCERLGLECAVIDRRDFGDDESFSVANFEVIRGAGCELVCLAGYLRLLLVPSDYDGRMINIHPALLPEFGGKGMYGGRVHDAVLAAGVTESGCTVHYVDNVYDHGEIILQRRIPVEAGETAAGLAARVFTEECLAFPTAIRCLQGIAVESI